MEGGEREGCICRVRVSQAPFARLGNDAVSLCSLCSICASIDRVVFGVCRRRAFPPDPRPPEGHSTRIFPLGSYFRTSPTSHMID